MLISSSIQKQLPYERKKIMKGFRYKLARDRRLDML
jgi:hypothetical protein